MMDFSNVVIDQEDSERLVLVKAPATETFQVIHFLFWLTVAVTTVREAVLLGFLRWESWTSFWTENPWWITLFVESVGLLTIGTALAWQHEKKIEINSRHFYLATERRIGFWLVGKKHLPFYHFKAVAIRKHSGWPEQWELRLVTKKNRELRIDRSCDSSHIQKLADSLAQRMMLPLLPC